jgi:hypothetical protein
VSVYVIEAALSLNAPAHHYPFFGIPYQIRYEYIFKLGVYVLSHLKALHEVVFFGKAHHLGEVVLHHEGSFRVWGCIHTQYIVPFRF